MVSTSTKLFYGRIYTASFGAGLYRGACAEKGIQIPPLTDILLTYAPPIGGTGVAFFREACPDGRASLISLVFGAAGGAAAGIGATVSEITGFGVGYFSSRILN